MRNPITVLLAFLATSACAQDSPPNGIYLVAVRPIASQQIPNREQVAQSISLTNKYLITVRVTEVVDGPHVEGIPDRFPEEFKVWLELSDDFQAMRSDLHLLVRLKDGEVVELLNWGFVKRLVCLPDKLIPTTGAEMYVRSPFADGQGQKCAKLKSWSR